MSVSVIHQFWKRVATTISVNWIYKLNIVTCPFSLIITQFSSESDLCTILLYIENNVNQRLNIQNGKKFAQIKGSLVSKNANAKKNNTMMTFSLVSLDKIQF